MQTILLVGLGGFFGANARYWLNAWIVERFGLAFPWGTMLINFSGSLLLGTFIGWSASRVELAPQVRLFLGIGFFGAYTTFSTFANESVALLQSGEWLAALGNILVTNTLCITGAVIGLLLGTRL